MPRLADSLHSWQTAAFEQTLKHEIEQLPGGQLPLYLGLTEGGMVDDSDIAVTVTRVEDKGSVIAARLGVFFTEVIGGCNCADDPIEKNVCCELQLQLDKSTAEADFSLAPD